MARGQARLTDRQARTAKPTGKITTGPNKGKPRDSMMLCDGGGLYLQVTIGADENVRRSWIFRYARPGSRFPCDMGLGPITDRGLAEAREISRQYRLLVREGKDPIRERDAEIARNRAASAVVMSFDEAAAAYIAQHRSGWSNPTHAAQWPASLATHVSPVIGKMSVADITTAHVMKVLEPIWTTRTQTAKRLRARIESVLGWSATSGYRKTGDNPARWKGHLENLLAKPSKVYKTKHMPALPYAELPGFVAELRTRTPSMASLALEFTLLTAVRSADIRHAKLAHINTAECTWTIAEFSKTGKKHRVPLSDAAIAVIERAARIKAGIGGAVGASDYLFPNDLTGAALGKNAMTKLLDRMGRAGQMTAHGMRSSFRTWEQEQTSFPREVAEMALGHVVGSAVERAYARGDMVEKRAAILTAWAKYCATPRPQSGKVVPLQSRGA
jgi:integrase